MQIERNQPQGTGEIANSLESKGLSGHKIIQDVGRTCGNKSKHISRICPG
ncbi:MAG: hypothetical protein ACE5IO_09800 [Thermoplasmata archaeon]